MPFIEDTDPPILIIFFNPKGRKIQAICWGLRFFEDTTHLPLPIFVNPQVQPSTEAVGDNGRDLSGEEKDTGKQSF